MPQNNNQPTTGESTNDFFLFKRPIFLYLIKV